MMDISVNNFSIAELDIRIIFKGTKRNNMRLLPSFEPFRVYYDSNNLLFRLTVDDNIKLVNKELTEPIRSFDTGNGNTIVDVLKEGGYQFIIKDINNNDCCLLQTNRNFSDCRCALNGDYNMRSFGINNALMLIFAYAGCMRDALMLHASLVRNNNWGYAFIAKSGTGKSTQVSFWLRYIQGCDLMNDDNPIIRIVDGKPYIFGSPWSGKTPCYRNIKARLGAITQIHRSKTNSIDKLQPIEAFATILTSCSSMKWDDEIYSRSCDVIAKVIEATPIYTLHCLPNRESAILCNKTISK